MLFRSLGSSARAAQLKVDKLLAKIESLDGRLVEREEALEEARTRARERGAQIRALETDLKKKNAVIDKHYRDDLKEINGIGPEFERKLRRMGIKTFGQLSELEGDGVERVAGRLGVPTARIRRERWVAAASRKHKAKYG